MRVRLITRPAWRIRYSSTRNSLGVSSIVRPARRTSRASRSTSRSATLRSGEASARGRRGGPPPRGGPLGGGGGGGGGAGGQPRDARQQLLEGERFRHVVVGAGDYVT